MRHNSRALLGLLMIWMAFWGLPLYASPQDQPQETDPVKTQSQVQEPSPLQAIEQLAEQVVVEAANKDWKKAEKDVSAIRIAWLDFQPVDPSNAEPASMDRMEYSLKQLAGFSNQHQRLATVLAANVVSSTVMDVYDLYHPELPGSVERLDEHQRRIILDTALGQFEDASRELQGMSRIWYYFKPALKYNGGEDLAEDLQLKLDLEQEFIDSKDRAKLLAAAQQALVSLFQVADLMG